MSLLPSKPFEVSLEAGFRIIIPEEIASHFIAAGHARVLVKASFESKEIEFHAALRKRMGEYQIMFSKRRQKELGLFPSDYFLLQLYEDTSKYGVEMPKELAAVFESDPEAFEIFEQFTDGKKRSLIYHIRRIKNPQIRIDKSLVISENIKRGITNTRDIIRPL